jgi:hypothetical protein
MVDRIRVRCRVCRSSVPVTVLWAVGEACPRCSQPLYVARRRPRPAGVLGETIALRHLGASAEVVRPGVAKR